MLPVTFIYFTNRYVLFFLKRKSPISRSWSVTPKRYAHEDFRSKETILREVHYKVKLSYYLRQSKLRSTVIKTNRTTLNTASHCIKDNLFFISLILVAHSGIEPTIYKMKSCCPIFPKETVRRMGHLKIQRLIYRTHNSNLFFA